LRSEVDRDAHPGDEPGDRRIVDAGFAGGLAREPLTVKRHTRAALITLLERSRKLALTAFQLREPLGAVERPP